MDISLGGLDRWILWRTYREAGKKKYQNHETKRRRLFSQVKGEEKTFECEATGARPGGTFVFHWGQDHMQVNINININMGAKSHACHAGQQIFLPQ